ncbi:MAG: hypothetical protein A2622_09515 [Bdellovibrionales bacterium RIFCSPHIGHO2_01_FULL_40_29]|nr:MAG: hypothetical protein A2622_09515 [Bdellovibrionales bacterium RIFCSPHIGHO2_01_FULL_40_29]OFZ33539.1 MAG: hypothetical protein A3D17_00105 [Bdellovibrionales bacterium RIFCSPHIGHO2_02_FULL_40_15]
MDGKTKFRFLLVLLIGLSFCTGCSKPTEDDVTVTNVSSRYLYVASGACYSGGGNTTFSNTTSSNVVYRIDLSTGEKDATIADYNSSPSQAGDSPVGIASIDSNDIYVLIENTTAGARRIEKVEKKSAGTRILFSNNTTALNVTLRGLHMLDGGDLLINKNTAIEKITSANVRVTKGASPYVNAPAAPCATSTTLMSKVSTLSNQFIVFLHAATSQNRFGFVAPAGYGSAGDCTPAQAAPNAASFPVATAYDAVNSKLIVAYAGNTTNDNINSIYAYDITETISSVTVGAANKIYDANQYPTTYPYLLYGISEMVLDPADNSLYIATAINTTTTIANYAIEKFSYDPTQIGVSNSSVLTRSGPTPFYNYGGDTKCISDMTIAE